MREKLNENGIQFEESKLQNLPKNEQIKVAKQLKEFKFLVELEKGIAGEVN